MRNGSRLVNTLKKWAMATRLETTLLALASVGLGSALAVYRGAFDGRVGVLAAITASLLQIVCNLANDYGDLVHGSDLINTVKPSSAIQDGLITFVQVKRVLPWLVGAAVGSGLLLLYIARLVWMDLAVFVSLGILAVIAAVTYTLGEKPYGYQGWGDVAVFVFFGLVGVGGTFYLHTQHLSSIWLLPAISCGSLAVSVLNVNNIRDLDADAQAGKKTIPVRIGRKAALYYHWWLLVVSIVSVLTFLARYASTPWSYTCLCVIPLLLRNGMAVSHQDPVQLTRQLQRLVFILIAFVVLLSIGLIL